MPSDTAYTRTFRRAIETLGGAERLATVLGVSVAEIQAWAAGYADPSPSVFLRAIDIVAQSWPLARGAAKA